MDVVSTEEARSQLSDILSRAQYAKERTIVTRHGRKVAAVVPIDDLEVVEAVLERLEYRADLREALAALDEIDREGTVSWEQLQRELGL